MQGLSFVAGLSHTVTVTPNDSTDNCTSSVGIQAGATGGTVKCTFQNGIVGTFYLSAGGSLAIRAKRVWATGTTATPIYALYG